MTTGTGAVSRFEVGLPRAIEPGLASDIEKQSVYVSPYIASLKVADTRDKIVVQLREGAARDEVAGKVDRFVSAMTSKYRKIDQKIHYARDVQRTRPLFKGVYDELRRRGWLFSHGQGQVSFSGPALQLLETLDRQLGLAYDKAFATEHRSFPAMIKADLLARCGYFEMHPNAVSFVCHAVEDFDELEAFRKANAGKLNLVVPTKESLDLPHYCLNPAACFPAYEALENQALPASGLVLTWNGRVFRYESKNIAGLDRLWEFNVRELVFIGTDEFVLTKRDQAKQLLIDLLSEWDLEFHIETATDPFFATVYAAKSFWQQSMDVKHEIRVRVENAPNGEPRTVAAGSINLHGAFFGTRFKIDDGQGTSTPAASGCIGFGLERLMLGVLAQHGLDPKQWPSALRQDALS